MNSEIPYQLLEKVSKIIKEFEKELDEDGSRFNIFSILNLASNEVRLHTPFIGELLNPEGKHTYGTQFLESFIKILRANIDSNNSLNSFNPEKAKVEIEKSTGQIDEKNYELGGQIDLILSDRTLNNNQIIIENKIFANDQRNQLLRYHNYNKNALLLYLTLEGSKPSEYSTNKQLIEGEHYYCVSYKELIGEWLEDCIKISENKHRVRETLSQYLHIVHDYTNQSKKHKMTSDIKKLIAANKDYFLAIPEITNSYNSFKETVIGKIWKSIQHKLPLEGIVISTDNLTTINYKIAEENQWGFYIEFCLQENGKTQPFGQVFEFLSAECLRMNNKSKKGPSSFWTNPKDFFLLRSLSDEKIFELNDEFKLDEFTNSLIAELSYYINGIKKSYKNNLKDKTS